MQKKFSKRPNDVSNLVTDQGNMRHFKQRVEWLTVNGKEVLKLNQCIFKKKSRLIRKHEWSRTEICISLIFTEQRCHASLASFPITDVIEIMSLEKSIKMKDLINF